MIIYKKLDNYFFVSADRQAFLGFEMMANLRDTSPLKALGFNIDTPILLIGFHILLMWYKWEESVLALTSRDFGHGNIVSFLFTLWFSRK